MSRSLKTPKRNLSMKPVSSKRISNQVSSCRSMVPLNLTITNMYFWN